VSSVAYRKRVGVPFYLILSLFFIAFSTTPNREGRKPTPYFTRLLGEPTLCYRDRRGDYEDQTAEWHRIEDREAIVRRIIDHLALGFKPEEL
jgi:hypothetical protein